MLNFSCCCQNYTGTLCVSNDEFYFTSSLYRLKLEWSNIKKISLDTKQIKGVPTSVLVVRQENNRSGSPDNSSTKDQHKSQSKKIFFYGFQDLLGAEEHIKAMWEANKGSSTAGKPSVVEEKGGGGKFPDAASSKAVNPTSDFQKDGVLVKSTLFNSGVMTVKAPKFQRAKEWLFSLFSYGWNIYCRGGVFSLLLLFIVLVSSILLGFHLYVDLSRKNSPMAAAVELLNDLELLDQYFSSLGSFSSVKEYHLFVKERERVFGSSHRWIDRLSSSTYDIVQDLVHQQLELNTLRGRRAKRLSGEKYANSNWKLTVTGRKGSRRYFLDEREAPTHKSGSIKKKRGGLSIDNAVDDFKRLYAFFAKIGRSVKEWIFTNPVPGGGKYKKVDKKDYVAYSEPFLEGYDLFEEVTVADKEEREQCLSIARKMVRSTRLLQDLFIEFFSIMAIDSFEAFGDGSVQPHFYGKEDTGDGLNSFKPFFSSDELVKVAFIRRYASLLVNINPLVPNEHMRHFKAIARSKASSEFAKMEQQLKESNRSTSKEELQMAFAESIRAEAADRTQGLYPLRNMVEEFKFWERNEELWMEHILSSLSLEQQRHLVQTHPKTASSDLGKDNRSAEDLFSDQLIVKWINLPIFKGLLCFTEQPDAYTVARGRSEERAERDGTKEYPFKEHKRYETLLAEVKGRWVNELELLKLSLHHINHPSASTKALRLSSLDTSSPHLANVTNSRRQFFTIIDRIGKHYISAFDEQKFSLIKFAGRLLTSVLPFVKSPKEGDGFSSLSRQISVSDPSVQVTIANVVDIPWATFHDMSLNILENIVSVSPDTLHFKKKLSRGVTVSTFILLLSVAILGTLAFVL